MTLQRMLAVLMVLPIGAVAAWHPLMVILVVVSACGMAVAGLALRSGRRVDVLLLSAAAFALPANAVRVTSWLTVADALLVLTAIAVTVTRRGRLQGQREMHWLYVGLGLVLLGGSIGSVSSGQLDAMGLLVRTAGGALATCLLLAAVGPDRRQLARVASAFAAGAGFSASWALLSLGAADRSLGLAVHPNHFGTTSLLGAAIGIGWLAASRGRHAFLPAAVSALCAAGVLTSGSRASVLGLAVAVVLLCLAGRSRGLVPVATLPLVALAAWFAAPLLPANNALARGIGSDQAAAVSATRSDLERARLLRHTLDLAWDHPLTGSGFSAVRDAHNSVLQVIVGGGVLALVGFLIVLAVVTGAARAVLRAGRVTHLGVHAGIVAAATGFMVQSAFQNNLWDRYLWLVLSSTALVVPMLRGSNSGRPVELKGTTAPSRSRVVHR